MGNIFFDEKIEIKQQPEKKKETNTKKRLNKKKILLLIPVLVIAFIFMISMTTMLFETGPLIKVVTVSVHQVSIRTEYGYTSTCTVVANIVSNHTYYTPLITQTYNTTTYTNPTNTVYNTSGTIFEVLNIYVHHC